MSLGQQRSPDLKQCCRVLGITPPASAEQVKQAYRDLVLVWHPDRFTANPRLQKLAEERIREINEAFRLLRNGFPPAIEVERMAHRDGFSEKPPVRERPTSGHATNTVIHLRAFWRTLRRAPIRVQGLRVTRIPWVPWVPVVAVIVPFCAAALWMIDTVSTLPMFGGRPEPSPALRLRSTANDLAARARALTTTASLDRAQDSEPHQATLPQPPEEYPTVNPGWSTRKRPAPTLGLENGTELIPPAGRRGAGSIRVENRAKLQAVVTITPAPGKVHSSPLRCVYLGAASEVTISGIPPGVYVVEAQLGKGWIRESFAFSDQRSSTGPLGPFSFLQIENEGGILGQEYSIVLQPQESRPATDAQTASPAPAGTVIRRRLSR